MYFCGFNFKSVPKQKKYSSFNHNLHSATAKIKSTSNPRQYPYLFDQTNGIEDSFDFQNNPNMLSYDLRRQLHSEEMRNQYRNFKRNKHFKNNNSFEHKNISTKMNCLNGQVPSQSNKSSVNRNLSENLNRKKRKKAHTYSVSDHISQMSTWQNSLISEFGMLPTLPCIPYFSVLDYSDDNECSDASYNESLVSVHNLYLDTFNDNVSQHVISDTGYPNVRSNMSSFNTRSRKMKSSLLPGESGHFGITDSSQYTSTRPFGATSLKHTNIESFKRVVSKEYFKYRFPKINFKFFRKHNNKSFVKTPSHLPGNANSNFVLSSNSNIKSNPLTVFNKKKILNFFSTLNIKRNNLNIKIHIFFRKFIFKNQLRTRVFRDKGTQTHISMFNDFLLEKSQMSAKKSISLPSNSHHKEDTNSFKNKNICYDCDTVHSISDSCYSGQKRISTGASRNVVNESYMHQKGSQSAKNASVDTTVSNCYDSFKQSTRLCACTCLCGVCSGYSGSRQILRRRTSSVVFVEIAASRKVTKSIDTLDSDEISDDGLTISTNGTHVSDNVLLNGNRLGTVIPLSKLPDCNDFESKTANKYSTFSEFNC